MLNGIFLFISLIGWVYIAYFVAKYLIARYIFKMSAHDLSAAMQEDGAFFIIKSSLDV